MQPLGRQHSSYAVEVDEVDDSELLQYQKTKSMPRIELEDEDSLPLVKQMQLEENGLWISFTLAGEITTHNVTEESEQADST